MHTPIILIGPLGVGKTTVGRLLAEKLALPFCSVDDVREEYYAQIGYDRTLAAQIAASGQGLWDALRYSKPFEARMVEMILAHQHGVIDFGASNSVYEEAELLQRVETALKPHPNVVLLLPTPEVDESAAILRVRLTRMLTDAGREFTEELFALNEYFLRQPSNLHLAKQVIYTQDKTPEAVCGEILQKLV